MDLTEVGPAPLSRQGSIYSLTFDELQTALGVAGTCRDFGSMNMDEFMRSIWTAEESQAIAAGSGLPAEAAAAAAAAGGTTIQRQGSLTLPRTLSVKTVDEVWRDLLRVETDAQPPQQDQQLLPRQQTLGEMTLEEFLVRAGVVKEGPAQPQAPTQSQSPQLPVAARPATGGSPGAPTTLFFGDYGIGNGNGGVQIGFGNPELSSLRVNTEIGNGNTIARNGMAAVAVGLGGGRGIGMPGVAVEQADDIGDGANGLQSSLSPMDYAFNGGTNGKKAKGVVEKVVERRQRRMIKNRESAARSRARKQVSEKCY